MSSGEELHERRNLKIRNKGYSKVPDWKLTFVIPQKIDDLIFYTTCKTAHKYITFDGVGGQPRQLFELYKAILDQRCRVSLPSAENHEIIRKTQVGDSLELFIDRRL